MLRDAWGEFKTKPALARVKGLSEVVLLGVAILGGCAVVVQLRQTGAQLRLTRESNDLTRQSLEFTKQSAVDGDLANAQVLAAAMRSAAAAERAAEVAASSLEATRKQLQIGERGLGLTTRSMDATTRQLGISERSLLLSESSIRARERPWVIVDVVSGQPDMFLLPHESKAVRVSFRVRNAGSLPALNVHIWGMAMTAQSFPHSPLLGERRGATSREVLAPGQAVELFHELRVLEPTRAALEEESLTAYLYGQIIYTGVLGEPHTTRFCREYIIRNRDNSGWIACDGYNEFN